MRSYSEDFYRNIQDGTLRSAREIVPLVMELIQPCCIIDIGCGTGIWLSVFREYGVKDLWGVDGNWVDINMLKIPKDRFIAFDLQNGFLLNRQFDLVVSLEVAEHLPDIYAERFIESLTRLGPVILFSAAIPLQQGPNHVNEQWPDYWAKFFEDRGYIAVDCIRRKIWNNPKVFYWYAQNILVFVKKNYLNIYLSLKKEIKYTVRSQLSIVHPKAYLRANKMVDIDFAASFF